jgi:hypothetical protein
MLLIRHNELVHSSPRCGLDMPGGAPDITGVTGLQDRQGGFLNYG